LKDEKWERKERKKKGGREGGRKEKRNIQGAKYGTIKNKF
jgi:hypothetical protein